jgi:hypothetical protein
MSCTGNRTKQTLHGIELISSFAMYGEDLMEVTGGDLAGWLDDLAPRGNLTSSQLLYRMCCFWNCLEVIDHLPMGQNIEAWRAAKVAHHMLLPLLVLAYQIPTPAREGLHAGGRSQRQGTQPPSSSRPAAAKRAQQARERLRSALEKSPMCLTTIYLCCKAVPGMMTSVTKKVEESVYQDGDKPGWIYDRVQSWINEGGANNSSRATARQEPLPKLIKGEELVWDAAWEGSYSAKEEGQHIKRLQAYVQAAADRAAGQLQGNPELVQRLRDVLV